MAEELTVDAEFLINLVKSLVDYEDDVKVERIVDERGVLLTLFVNPEDLGRVIGKRGATAESIRTLLRSLGMKHDAHYNLKIADTDDGAGKKTPDNESSEPKRGEQVRERNDRGGRRDEGRVQGGGSDDMYNYSRPARRGRGRS